MKTWHWLLIAAAVVVAVLMFKRSTAAGTFPQPTAPRNPYAQWVDDAIGIVGKIKGLFGDSAAGVPSGNYDVSGYYH